MNNFHNFIIVKALIEHECGFRGEATVQFDKTMKSISIDDCVTDLWGLVNRGKPKKIIGKIKILIDFEKYVENEKEKYTDEAVKMTIK